MTRDDEPSTYELLETVRLTRSVVCQWLVVSTVGFFGFAYLFGRVLEVVTGVPLEPISITVTSPRDVLVGIAALAIVFAIVIVPHELIHGAVMARYGGDPEYGVGVAYFVLPYAYARSDGVDYGRNEMLAILLAPLVVITVAGLVVLAAFPSPIVIVALAANAAGSIGDCWMAATLIRYPKESRVGELPGDGSGMAIYGPGSTRSRTSTGEFLSTFVYGAAGTLTIEVVGLVAIVLGSLAFGSGDVTLGDPDGFWFLFRHEVDPDGLGAAFEVGFPLLASIAVVGGAVAVFLSRFRESADRFSL